MWNFWKSRLRKGISIVAALVLLLNSIMPTVPVFADEENSVESDSSSVVEAVVDEWWDAQSFSDESSTDSDEWSDEEPSLISLVAESVESLKAGADEDTKDSSTESQNSENSDEEWQSNEETVQDSSDNVPQWEDDVSSEWQSDEPSLLDMLAESVETLIEETKAEVAEQKAIEEVKITWPSWTSKISKLTVTVSAPKSSIEEGTYPIIRDLTDEEIELYREYFIEAWVSEKDMVTFDITFYDADGNEITD